VDLLEGVEVRDADLGGREAHNGSILLVQVVDVEDSLAGDDGAFEAEVCEACVPWSGQVTGWACEADVEELAGELGCCGGTGMSGLLWLL
jgi:hypothetical protein